MWWHCTLSLQRVALWTQCKVSALCLLCCYHMSHQADQAWIITRDGKRNKKAGWLVLYLVSCNLASSLYGRAYVAYVPFRQSQYIPCMLSIAISDAHIACQPVTAGFLRYPPPSCHRFENCPFMPFTSNSTSYKKYLMTMHRQIGCHLGQA